MLAMSWCPTCEDPSPSHPDNMCMTCGDELTALPAGASSRVSQPSSSLPRDGSRGGNHTRLVNRNGGANTNTNNANHNIMTAEGAVLDPSAWQPLLDHFRGTNNNGIANMIELNGNNVNVHTDNNNLADIASLLPPEALNPQAGPTRHHPVSKKVLNEIQNKKAVMTEQSAELFDACVTLSEPRSLEADDGKIIATAMRNITSSDSATNLGLNAVPGEFGPLANANRNANAATTAGNSKASATDANAICTQSTSAAALVICSPLTTKGGKLSPSTLRQIEILRKRRIPFVGYVERGDGITFVQKALVCQRAGEADEHGIHADGSKKKRSLCMGVIVGNRGTTGSQSEVWPYIMQDTKGEAEKFGLHVPVVMVRREDGKRLIRWASRSAVARGEGTNATADVMPATMLEELPNDTKAENVQTAKQTPLHQQQENYIYTPCRIQIRPKQSNACPVCTEIFRTGDTIVRLPLCGHVFHEACAMAWLTKHNTCPYCRKEYPTEDEGFEAERRRRERERGSVGVDGGHDFYG
mmetsp:Transcript_31692/g.64375  ORF Transcript_31692/g.64375 Transcript_31692/m.64375 type:complete len:527 (-) Transcript_31692:132-1712(-)